MTASKIHINDFQPNIYIGFSTNLEPDQNNFFSLTKTQFDQTKENLTNLLNTEQGERIMNPTYGRRLKRFVFEQGDNLENGITDEIEMTIHNWMPEVNIDNIDIKRDENAVEARWYFLRR